MRFENPYCKVPWEMDRICYNRHTIGDRKLTIHIHIGRIKITGLGNIDMIFFFIN